MRFIRHWLLAVGLFLIAAGGGTKTVKGLETDTKPIVPEYEVNAKELLGTPLKESQDIVRATTDFGNYMSEQTSLMSPLPVSTGGLHRILRKHSLIPLKRIR